LSTLFLSVGVRSVGVVEKTRQLLPEGLADMPPGPRLAAVLDSIEPSRLGGLDCVEALRAHARQVSHEQARFMAAMVEVGLCGIGPDDQLPRRERPDEFAADEIRAALALTRSAATTQLTVAWDLTDRLPEVLADLDRGQIDVPKARVFSEWTTGLTDVQARQICSQLLPEAPQLTTGQLCERIKKLAIAVDPDWARRRYEEAVRERKVVAHRNEDGTGTLSGQNLPADQVAASRAHIDALARRVKQAGDGRRIDLVKADLFVGMTDGTFTGYIEADIITHMLARARSEPAATDAPGSKTAGSKASEADRDESRGVAHRFPRSGQHDRHRNPDDRRPAQHDASERGPVGDTQDAADSDSGSEHRQPGPALARRTGVEIRAEITTLLGLDDHPAEIAGWGHVHADLARQLVREQTDAEWRYAICDDDGCLLYEGITRRRPDGYPARADAPTRGGIVELQITLSDLRHLAARPARLGEWAKVIADLAHQADQHDHDTRHPPQTREPGSRGSRSPGASLRRRTQIRDRTCVHPGCRAPAARTDGDHTHAWAEGGATRDDNIGSLCRHDHRLKHAGGWQVAQPAPGYFVWTSRLGRRYHIRPPLIIQPLPDPIPRIIPYGFPPPRHDPDADADGHPTWPEPPEPEEPAAEHPRRPDPEEKIPPF
jgi:hypothetical protein